MSETPQIGRSAPGVLSERLRSARMATPELFSDAVNQAGVRHSARIDRLIKSGAWADAALAMIEMELPQWRLRRIAYDDGEWHCALSRQRELPDWLDQAIEYSHFDLSLAMLGAFIDAQGVSAPSTRTSVPGVPYVAELSEAQLCCDNFE